MTPVPTWLKTTFRVLHLGRLHFLASGLLLFTLGALWAALLGAPFSLARAAFGYAVLFPAHLSLSYSNDYFDVEVDRFNRPTLFTGGSGVLVRHPELRALSKWIALALLACSLLLGVAFTLAYRYPPAFLGYVVAGGLLGWFYAAPPLRLSYRGLGELATALGVGVAVPGMGFLALAGRLSWPFAILGAPVLLYALAFILAVEIPDVEADRRGRKWTLVARKGRRFGFALIGVLLALASAYFFVAAQVLRGRYRPDFGVAGLLSLLPLAAGLLGALRRPVDRAQATRLVNLILLAFIAFVAALDVYFALLM